MITNALTINSGGRSPAARRAESRARGVQRRLNIAPLQMTFDNNSPAKAEMSSEDVSLYCGNSPQGSPRPCSISPCIEMGLLSPLRETEMIEERHDIDFNSMDSGFSNNCRTLFHFVQPHGLPPKPSPPKSAKKSPPSSSFFRSFNSLSSDSMESMDDECMDLLDMESLDDNSQLPTSFNSIISGNIKSTNEISRPIFRRCLSMTDNNVNRAKNTMSEPKTPEVLKSIAEVSSPFQPKLSESCTKTFKRPEPPSICSPVQSKRYKLATENKENSNDLPVVRPVLRKSMSMNDAIIMNALARCKYLLSRTKMKAFTLNELNC